MLITNSWLNSMLPPPQVPLGHAEPEDCAGGGGHGAQQGLGAGHGPLPHAGPPPGLPGAPIRRFGITFRFGENLRSSEIAWPRQAGLCVPCCVTAAPPPAPVCFCALLLVGACALPDVAHMAGSTSEHRDGLPLQDMGVRGLEAAHDMLAAGKIYLETRTGAAQAEGNIHDMHSFEKVRW